MAATELIFNSINRGQIEGAVLLILIYTILRAIDYILKRWTNEKFFARLFALGKRKVKIYLTKHNPIIAKYEFSVYFRDQPKLQTAREQFDRFLSEIEQTSSNEVSVENVHWDSSSHEAKVEFSQSDKESSYSVLFTLVPREDRTNAETEVVGSMGIVTEFHFEFGELENAIIDLGAFNDFLYQAVRSKYSVRNITSGRFIVSTKDNALTLDEWVQKEQFDVSLCLESQDEQRAVRFYGDRAEITTANNRLDRITARYVRKTLLNYYL